MLKSIRLPSWRDLIGPPMGFNLFKINRKSLLLEEIINLNLIGEEARILRPIQNSLIIATDRGNVKVFDLASKSVC